MSKNQHPPLCSKPPTPTKKCIALILPPSQSLLSSLMFCHQIINNDGSNTASEEFTVKVNKPPTVVAPGISDLPRMEGFGTEDIDFSGTFTDPDAGDMLTFSVMSADEGVVTATISPGTTTLTITEVGPGSSEVTVTATDGNGGMVSDTFTVEMEGTWSLVRIYDFTGRHIHVPVREQGSKKVVLDISGLPGGIYLVKVSGGGGSTVRRLVVE